LIFPFQAVEKLPDGATLVPLAIVVPLDARVQVVDEEPVSVHEADRLALAPLRIRDAAVMESVGGRGRTVGTVMAKCTEGADSVLPVQDEQTLVT
jgi:hypothetical protein